MSSNINVECNNEIFAVLKNKSMNNFLQIFPQKLIFAQSTQTVKDVIQVIYSIYFNQ